MSNIREEEQSQSQRTQRPAASVRESKAKTYVTTRDLPSRPQVRLLFEGLLWFVFHGKDECQVGIHNTTHAGSGHPHQHDLDIKVWTIESGCHTAGKVCKLRRLHIGDPKTIAGIQIDVNSPVTEGVYVYQRNPFNRFGTSSDPNDWRWVLDLEEDEFYADGIQLKDMTINPGVSINHGVFHTLHRTTSTFKLVPDDDTVPIEVGRLPMLVGCNIELKTGGDVTLVVRRTFPSKSIVLPLKLEGDKCYQIDIRNICVKGNSRCPPGEYGDDENDFYMFNENFTRPLGTPEYTLSRVVHNTVEEPPPYLCFTPDDMSAFEEKQTPKGLRSSNDAPCGPLGAGGGGGG